MKTLSNAFKKSLFGPIDLFDCGTRMVNTIGPRIANDEKGSRMTDYLKGELVNLNIATERTRARPQTVLIMEKDAKRDELLFMLRDTLKGNTHNVMNPEFREAANALSKLYADHIGNVNSMGLGEESKAVRYLLDALSTEENERYATVLGIDPLITSLSQVQDEIETLYVERTNNEPTPGQSTVKTHMEAAADALRRFLGYIDALTTGGAPESAEINDAALAIINDVEAIARGRKTRMRNGEEEPQAESLNEAA
jgi:hypothetical protein